MVENNFINNEFEKPKQLAATLAVIRSEKIGAKIFFASINKFKTPFNAYEALQK